jgi:hypothetical protein
MKVIGKSTEGMDDGLRIPPFLEFQALTLDGSPLDEFVNIDRQADVRHGSHFPVRSALNFTPEK